MFDNNKKAFLEASDLGFSFKESLELADMSIAKFVFIRQRDDVFSTKTQSIVKR